MSARHEARAQLPPLQRPNSPASVPAAFLVGRCLEVWADENAESAHASTMRRFSDARTAWAAVAGRDPDEVRQLIPNGCAWSIENLPSRGQAKRIGRPVHEVVTERLDRAGCTVADLPGLRAEADRFYATAGLGTGALRRAITGHEPTTPDRRGAYIRWTERQ